MSNALSSQTTNQTTRIAEALLNGGADVNARDDLGATALIEASDRSNAPLIRLLLKRGADVNVRAGGGNTALTLARYRFDAYKLRRSNPQYRKTDTKMYNDTSAIYFLLKAAGAKE